MSQQRYLLKEILGRGGMGAVYKAWDNETRREVTVKTLLDVGDRGMLDLFYKECRVLASLNHPNIVDIYDVGEMDIDGGKRPYFVMPLLPGSTLDRLIAAASPRLTIPAVVEMLSQASRGLHAAHERGLVHRDIKPSNIFVMDDDSVKIIDFGVAHLSDSRTSTTLKGTLHYMAPEQVQLQKPTALSDMFSLAVVAYQAFTRRRPFEGNNMDETIQAILNKNPPPVSELNKNIPRAISQVVHKAMAKQPWHRFTTTREFGDNLQRALRGDSIDVFDDSKIIPRIQKARRALDSGEHEFAQEVLSGLEAEGFLHPDVGSLRADLDQAVRARKVSQLIATARRFLEEDEYQLALQKIQDLLTVDPQNAQALELRAEIESRRSSEQVERWRKLARQHIENHAYPHARQALENALQLDPADTESRRLLAEIHLLEQDYRFRSKEKEALYQSAMEAWQRGDLSKALSGMERVLDLDRRSPGSSGHDSSTAYQNFFNQVRSEHDALAAAYQQAQKHLADGNHQAALALCDTHLARYPDHAMFQSVKVDAEEMQRQDLSAFIARIDRQVESEPDLDRRIGLLEQAVSQRPGEPHLERVLQVNRSKRELVHSIVNKARLCEERQQFTEALSQWEMVRSIYPIYPGLEIEIDRARLRREQNDKAQSKTRWTEKIDQAIHAGDFASAIRHSETALTEFPGDPELEALAGLARQRGEFAEQAGSVLRQGRDLIAAGRLDEGLDAVRQAVRYNPADSRLRADFLDILVRAARTLSDSDWKRAEDLVAEALALDPSCAPARSLQALLQDRKRAEFVEQCVTRARQFQASNEMDQALAAVNQGLAAYPSDQRLQQLKAALERGASQARRGNTRARDLERARALELRAKAVAVPEVLETLFEETVEIARQHLGDQDFEAIVDTIRRRRDSLRQAPARTPTPQPSVQPPAPPVAPARAQPESPPVAEPAPAPAAPRPALRFRVAPAPPPETASAAKKTVAQKPAAKRKALPRWAPVAGALLIVSAGVLAFVLIPRGETPPAPVETASTPAETIPPPTPAPAETLPPAPAPEAPAESPAPAAPFKGSVMLTVNEPGFDVYVDGQRVRHVARGANRYQVSMLNPGKREIRIEKQGFRSEPRSLALVVRENQSTPAEFRLAPEPQTIRLSVRGAVPGTEILEEGRLIGTADEQGSFSTSGLTAGNHGFSFRLRGYRPKQSRVTLRPGEVSIGPPDSVVERIDGFLTFSSEPKTGVTLRIEQTNVVDLRYAGPATFTDLSRELRLPAGTYNLFFTAPGYDMFEANVPLTDGRRIHVTATLQRRR